MIDKQKRCEKDLVKVKKYYEEAKDKRIIVLDEPLFYKDYLPLQKLFMLCIHQIEVVLLPKG